MYEGVLSRPLGLMMIFCEQNIVLFLWNFCTKKIIDRILFCGNILIGNLRARRLTLFGGANPPDEREEGDANVCYIFGSDPDRYLLGIPCRFVLYTLQGKTKIAAITHNNDGC